MRNANSLSIRALPLPSSDKDSGVTNKCGDDPRLHKVHMAKRVVRHAYYPPRPVSLGITKGAAAIHYWRTCRAGVVKGIHLRVA